MVGGKTSQTNTVLPSICPYIVAGVSGAENARKGIYINNLDPEMPRVAIWPINRWVEFIDQWDWRAFTTKLRRNTTNRRWLKSTAECSRKLRNWCSSSGNPELTTIYNDTQIPSCLTNLKFEILKFGFWGLNLKGWWFENCKFILMMNKSKNTVGWDNYFLFL